MYFSRAAFLLKYNRKLIFPVTSIFYYSCLHPSSPIRTHHHSCSREIVRSRPLFCSKTASHSDFPVPTRALSFLMSSYSSISEGNVSHLKQLPAWQWTCDMDACRKARAHFTGNFLTPAPFGKALQSRVSCWLWKEIQGMFAGLSTFFWAAAGNQAIRPSSMMTCYYCVAWKRCFMFCVTMQRPLSLLPQSLEVLPEVAAV